MKGGKRKGAGRLKLSDKKVQLPIYIPESHIEKLSRPTCREIATEAIKTQYEKK
jgi:hypothetical protein